MTSSTTRSVMVGESSGVEAEAGDSAQVQSIQPVVALSKVRCAIAEGFDAPLSVCSVLASTAAARCVVLSIWPQVQKSFLVSAVVPQKRQCFTVVGR